MGLVLLYFLVLQSDILLRKRELVALLYFNCLPDVLLLLASCGSSSGYRGLVCCT